MNLGKPFLRGHFHQAAFFVAIGACLLLLSECQQSLSFWAALIYSLSLVTLLGVSALYHRINWGPVSRMLMRRLDHAAIYFLIAGTLTPICLLALSQESGSRLLVLSWSVAAAGMLLSIFFVRKPKWLNVLCFVASALVILPYTREIVSGLGSRNVICITVGGAAYLIGALSYATKRPRLFPRVFGYHEVFHLLVLVGGALHFVVVRSLTT